MSPILKAALRWLALMLGCDRVPPAASAPEGKAATSLIYHVQWYSAATTCPQCLHAFIRRGAQHSQSCSSLRYITLPSTPLCLREIACTISV